MRGPTSKGKGRGDRRGEGRGKGEGSGGEGRGRDEGKEWAIPLLGQVYAPDRLPKLIFGRVESGCQ